MRLPKTCFYFAVKCFDITSEFLTERCWKSHALMMFVATLGKIPRFLFLFLSLSKSSSSPVLGEATLLSRQSPVRKKIV